jgi:hypothetical protein
MTLLIGFLYFAVDLLAAVLLVATWQHTRIKGFLWVAASVVLGILLRWAGPYVFRFSDSEDFQMVNLAAQLVFIAVTALGVAGFWDIYRRLKQGRPVSPPAA